MNETIIGGFERAIQDYNRAIELKPDYAKAFNNRGYVYDEKGEFDHAIRDYDRAVALQPDYAKAFNISYAKKKGQYDRAIQDYNEAIKLEPEYAEALNNRGSAYFGKREYDHAIQDYDGAIKLSCSETAKLDRFWLEFSAVIPWLGGAESDEGIEVFGRPEGVHSQTGR